MRLLTLGFNIGWDIRINEILDARSANIKIPLEMRKLLFHANIFRAAKRVLRRPGGHAGASPAIRWVVVIAYLFTRNT